MIYELFDWAPYALSIIGPLFLFGCSVAVCERYAQNARDETIAERAARRFQS